MKKHWTQQEVAYLENAWGECMIPTIAAKLGRTIVAVKLKAGKIGLGRHLHCGEEITFCQLLHALGQYNNYSQHKISWVKHGFPMKYKRSIQKRFMVVNLDAFWRWAEQHKNLLDFSGFEENMLGKEPTWVSEKRRADIAAKAFKKTPWTVTEDQFLILLLNQYKYGYKEISEKLCRTEGAIKRRMTDLGLKQRPVRADNHIPWPVGDIETVKSLAGQGYIPEIIARHVGRSACAVRGLLERLEA